MTDEIAPHCPTCSVSVVTPTWNRRALLMETMDSVAAQTLESWEHIVVDDGSDDGTREAVAQRAAADPRVRYLARTGGTRGANVCRNLGWRAAQSDLVVFLDSDDLLDRDSLALRVQAMQRNQDLDFCVFRTGVFSKTPGDLNRELVSEDGGDDLLAFLFFETPWQTTAPTWRRAALEKLQGFDETLPSWQDIDLHVRAISAGQHYLRYPRIDHHMRWHWEDTKVSIMQKRSPEHLRAADATLRKFEQVVRQGPGMSWVRQRALCSLYFLVAELWIGAGQGREALRSWRLARQRHLASAGLHLSGAFLLWLQTVFGNRWLLDRLTHKWKGLVRFRTNPKLVPNGK